MKTLVLLIAALALVVVFLPKKEVAHLPQSQQQSGNAGSVVSATAFSAPATPSSPSPTPTGKDFAKDVLANGFEKLLNPDGTLKKIPNDFPYFKVWGRVYQHLNGQVLMESNLGFIALKTTIKDPWTDGEYINQPFNGIVGTTYQYRTVDGGTRTVREVLFLPPNLTPVGTRPIDMYDSLGK